ncbi:hypothetical protein BR93DRAFT_927452 [Coniochaeta sp. PMI_546]|nr:hypothetical protein BR93DRAFT_927452 [Coniochaeta sp. PMI_546]
MADVAALVHDIHGPASPMSAYPAAGPYPSGRSPSSEPPKDRSGVVSYSYSVTSHETKQAALDRYRGLGDAYAPPSPAKEPRKEAPEDLAYYKLLAAYERNDASRRAGEALADEYERYCLQYDGDRDQTRRTVTETAKPRRNVCNSCLRPFDDDHYKPKVVARAGDANPYPVPASDISFDVELGTWKVHFSRNMEQEALYGKTATAMRQGEGEEEKKSPGEQQPPLDIRDGGYVDFHSHLHGDGNNVLPVRTKKETPKPSDVPAVVALAAEKAAAEDFMADYDAFLRSNHVVTVPVRPKETPKIAAPAADLAGQKAAATGDVMADYDEFLRSNHVVTVPVRPKETPKIAAPAADLAGQKAAATGDVMADYDEFLRSNHVVTMPVRTKSSLPLPAPAVDLAAQKAAAGDVMADYDEFLRSNHVVGMPPLDKLPETNPAETKPAAAVEVEMEDEDMDYVDVRDEEFLDYLRGNHITEDVVQAEKASDSKAEPKTATTKPVVNIRATSYEDYFEFGSNVAPYDGLRLG